MINYGKQTINEDDIRSVAETLKSDFLTCGPKVDEFEKKFSDYVGSRYAVAVSSGTAALHLACMAAGLKSGDELITSAMSFSASSNCALYCGAKPVFSDIDDTGLMDIENAKSLVSEKTKIIIPVHYRGACVDMQKLSGIREKGITVIEDACHALGARYKDTMIGDCTNSDMSMFSFHPVKHITTGEGGIITTNDEELYRKLRLLRNHGIEKTRQDEPWFQEMTTLGYNYRLTDIQCALGISQLDNIDTWVRRRKNIAQRYDKALSKIKGVEIIKDKNDNSYHLYVAKVDDREGLFKHLKENGINCQVHYLPIYLSSYYASLGYNKGLCPEAEKFYEKIISLPMYPVLTDDEIDMVVENIRRFYR